MVNISEVILVLIIVGLVWVVYKSYQHNEADKKEITAIGKERDEYVELGKGLAEYNQKLVENKNLAKDKILGILKDKARTSNQEIIKELDISHTSAMRYLDDLEKEERIKQIGKTGRNVYYTKL